MSSERPSRLEVMGWGPQQLADYLKRRNLPGCDKVVLKNSISGARFVNLTDSDFQKFPKLQAPMISKLSNEIRRNEGKRSLFGKKQAPVFPDAGFCSADTSSEAQGWSDNEFEDDDDYESPYSDEKEESDNYESPSEDPSNEYEPPPSAPSDDGVTKFYPTSPIGEGDYIDKRDNHTSNMSAPPALSPRPLASTLPGHSSRDHSESSFRREPSPHCVGRAPGKFPPEPPQICRSSKPGREPGSNSFNSREAQNSAPERSGGHSWRPQPDPSDPHARSKPPPALPPSSTSIGRSNSSARPPPNRYPGPAEQTQKEVSKHSTFPLHNKSLAPRPGIPGIHSESMPSAGSLPHKLSSAIAEHRGSFVGSERQTPRPPLPTNTHMQDLDPRWYAGMVSRGQAEACLKQVHKDGAYLVRDSIRQKANQPFTLMVFYQDKVYNVQIRQENQVFHLGTGLKSQESFSSVAEIISLHSHSPLLLIDAKNRGSGQQNQCLLSDPVANYITGQKW
uniref:SH2 domain-containing protein n=1 Tax=Oryzias sinensis TaxID=183150 RepID=A0A8C7X2S5_9TELE